MTRPPDLVCTQLLLDHVFLCATPLTEEVAHAHLPVVGQRRDDRLKFLTLTEPPASAKRSYSTECS